MTHTAGSLALVLLTVAVALTVYRLLARRSTTADRVVALDLLVTLLVGATTLFAVLSERSQFLDLAVGVSVVGFVGTAMIGRFTARDSLR